MKTRESSVWLRRASTVGLFAALAIALWGAYLTHANVSATFDRQTQIQAAQVTLEEMLRLQIVEENAIRGYIATRDSVYKDQYATALANFQADEKTLRAALQAQNLTEIQGEIDDYEAWQREWRDQVAAPSLAHPVHSADVDLRSKFYSMQQANVSKDVRDKLGARNQKLASDTIHNVDLTTVFSVFFFIAFSAIAFWIASANAAVRRELDRERTTTETLQSVFTSRTVPLPNCEVGSAYAAASSHLAVGGDVFDMYRLSERNALIVIADVSGKGVDAAVLTAFIKFTIRSIALRRSDPGAILVEFNRAFAQAYTVDNPSLFVSMFVGVLDTDLTYMKYASAGHDSAFVRRNVGVQQLAVTGPILGVMEEPFETRTVQLDIGDMIVLATDGLTEARYPDGELLHEQGAMDLIERSSPEPQQMADELVAQVRVLGGNKMRDDLAILAIKIVGTREDDA